jgi:hypothetical protein
MVMADDVSGNVTESWSATKNVPEGRCSVQFCVGTHCSKAESRQGVPSDEFSASPVKEQQPTDSESLSDSSMNGQQPPGGEIAPSTAQPPRTTTPEPNVNDRIDDAFTQLEAGRYKVDTNGNPDVTQTANPALEKALHDRAYEMREMDRYYQSDLPPEVRARPEYQELVRLNDFSDFSPLSEEWKRTIFNDTPISEGSNLTTASLSVSPDSETTFGQYHPDDKYGHFRLSTNVEHQTWSEYVSASAHGAVIDIKNWYLDGYNRISDMWRNTFGR